MTPTDDSPHRRPSSADEVVRDRDGRPIVDRYGRPVRRNPRARQTPGPLRPDVDQGYGQNYSQGPGRSYGPSRARIDETRAVADPAGRPHAEDQRQQDLRAENQRAQDLQAERFRREAAEYRQSQQAQYSQQAARPGQAAYGAARPASARPAGQRPDAAGQRPRRPRRRIRPNYLRIAGALLAVFLVLATAVTMWADTRLTRVDAMPARHIAGTAGTNWLLVGSDSRTGLSEQEQADLATGGDTGGQRTDSIMLLHLPTFGKATLVSLPRDSYVDIPGYGTDKINAAFAYGGPPLLIETVEASTGLRVDHYAEVGFAGFAGIVDTLGGVTLCPTDPIDDPLAGINIPAGCQPMDGATALGYVRTRATPLGDLDRVVRQREFMSALFKKVASPGTLLNPFRVLSLVGSGFVLFSVDKGDHIWHLARVATALAGGAETVTVPVSGTSDSDVGSVVLWDESAAATLFDGLR